MHDAPDDLEAPPRRGGSIGVRLRESGRADDYLVEDLELHVGDSCWSRSAAGTAVGEVRRPARACPPSSATASIRAWSASRPPRRRREWTRAARARGARDARPAQRAAPGPRTAA